MRAQTAGPLLRLYERAVRAGVMDHAVIRRAFQSVYLAYKQVLEAGPVGGLRPFVPPGSTVVDVGANIGFFALRFGRWVGPSGRVVAIEPEQGNLAALRRRVSRAKLSGTVECVHAAAADKPGELRLALNPVHPGDHHIAETGEPVTAVTVDELVRQDDRLSFIKIDVQGAEGLVLDGAQDAIARHRPAIFIEVHNESLERFSSSSAELLTRLEALDYRGHTLSRSGVGPEQTAAELLAQSAGTYIDVLFLPSGSG